MSYYIYYKFDEYFSESQVKKYFCEILLAIEELHKYDIIFWDLKPENIILDCEGHIKLIDFGLAKINVTNQNKGAESFCGSHAYLAPEMILKNGHGKAIDYYSLGILLYEMIIGRPPFYDTDRSTMQEKVLKDSLCLPKEINKCLESFMKGLLEKNMEKRLGYKNGF